MHQGLRILHIADSHIGADLPRRPRLNLPRRGDDIVASFRRVLARAREFNVDLVIHAGDLFDRSRPHPTAITAAALPLLEVASAGIPVVIVPGTFRGYDHAAMLDPHTAAELDLDQIVALVDDLIEAHGDWLPKYV